MPDGPECFPLISDGSDDEASSTEGEDTETLSRATEATDDVTDEGGNGDEEEWVPHHQPTPKARPSEDSSMSSVASSMRTKPKGAAPRSHISHLQKEMQGLTLHAESDSDLSAYIPPSKKTHLVASLSEDESNNGAPATVKKKQR